MKSRRNLQTRISGISQRSAAAIDPDRHATYQIAHPNGQPRPKQRVTGVLVAGSIHFIAATPHAPFSEVSVTESGIRKELLKNPFKQKDGYVDVPQLPGLGIELNTDIIEKYGSKV